MGTQEKILKQKEIINSHVQKSPNQENEGIDMNNNILNNT